MLDEVARALNAPEHEVSDPMDSHILRGVCLMLPMLQSRNDVQIHIYTRNGVCALATWLSRLLGLVVEVTQWQGDNRNNQPSIIRLGPKLARIGVKINTVGKNDSCVALIGLRILTKINNPALLAEMGNIYNYEGSPEMIKFQRDGIEYRLDGGRNLFQYEKIHPFLRFDPKFWLDRRVNGVTRRPVKGLGGRMLEWAATAFAGVAGDEGRNAWIGNLRSITIAFALDVAVHLQKCSAQLLPEESVTTNSIQPRFNEDINDKEDLAVVSHSCVVPPGFTIEAARLIFDDQGLAGPFDELYQSEVGKVHLERSALCVAKDLGVLLLTFAHVIRLDSCVELPLNCEFSLLDDQALVRRIRTWDGSSSISVQEIDWFEIVAKLLVGRSEVINSGDLNSTSLLSDHGWSIYRPSIDLRRDPSDIGKSLIVIL